MFTRYGLCHSGGAGERAGGGAAGEAGGECQEDETIEKDKTKVSGKEYYHFWKSLPEAPRAVQEAVQKVKRHPKRVGKQKQVAYMAKAYVKQKWDHKLFKSIQQERPQAREGIVMPNGHHGGQVWWQKCL